MVSAVVPIKRLDTSKQRLAVLLSGEERRRLTVAMLLDVLAVLRAHPMIGEIHVVTPDPKIPALLKAAGAAEGNGSGSVGIIREPEQTTLNAALVRARSLLTTPRTESILFIPADIPLMSSAELDMLLDRSESSRPGVRIVPDKTSTGTNFLLLRPPAIIEPCFGAESFTEHLRSVGQKGGEFTVHRAFGISWDIDTAEDLEMLRRHGEGTKAFEEVRLMGMREQRTGR